MQVITCDNCEWKDKYNTIDGTPICEGCQQNKGGKNVKGKA